MEAAGCAHVLGVEVREQSRHRLRGGHDAADEDAADGDDDGGDGRVIGADEEGRRIEDARAEQQDPHDAAQVLEAHDDARQDEAGNADQNRVDRGKVGCRGRVGAVDDLKGGDHVRRGKRGAAQEDEREQRDAPNALVLHDNAEVLGQRLFDLDSVGMVAVQDNPEDEDGGHNAHADPPARLHVGACADLQGDSCAEGCAANVYAECGRGELAGEPCADDLRGVGVQHCGGEADDEGRQEQHEVAIAGQRAPNRADKGQDEAGEEHPLHADAVGQRAREQPEEHAREVGHRHDHGKLGGVALVALHQRQGAPAGDDEAGLKA